MISLRVEEHAVSHNGGLDGLQSRLEALAGKRVYVGVPESKAARGDKINNPSLLYIHTHGIRRLSMRREMQPMIDAGLPYSKAFKLYILAHGSPLWHAPPRPVLEPAVMDAKDKLSALLGQAIAAAAEGDNAKAQQMLEYVGMLAQNAARGWFTNPKNGWPPNRPYTIKRKGSSRPLIDTGALRQSIVYVVRDV